MNRICIRNSITLSIVLLIGCAETRDPIDRAVNSEYVTSGLWENGAWPTINLPKSASAEEVIAKYFSAPYGRIHFKEIEKSKKFLVRGKIYTAALVMTDHGEMIVFLRYEERWNGWWIRMCEANSKDFR